jgi:ABC-type glycerol-3-phosphate transport system substrate-binding protein
MEVRVNVEHRPQLHVQARFLTQFAAGAKPDIFIPLDVAAGNAPHTIIGAAPFDQEQPALLEYNDRNANGRIFVLNETTFRARGTESLALRIEPKGSTA